MRKGELEHKHVPLSWTIWPPLALFSAASEAAEVLVIETLGGEAAPIDNWCFGSGEAESAFPQPPMAVIDTAGFLAGEGPAAAAACPLPSAALLRFWAWMGPSSG